MNILSSNHSKAASLLPFGYYAVTRVPGWRDFCYLIASSWIPVIWIIFRTSSKGLGEALLAFVIGYLAFIAIYEIGYLVNDVWDSRKRAAGRSRTPFSIGSVYVAFFVVVRLTVWAAIAVLTRWVANPVWLAGFAGLVATIVLHNLISATALRVSSFYGLAMFRFAMPAVAAIRSDSLLLLFIAATLFYALPRTLAYMDSKELLQMPDRRHPQFTFLFLLVLSPITLLIAAASSALIAEILIYMLAVSGFWAVAQRVTAAESPPRAPLERLR